MYIADGNNIRMVDEFGTISTLAGHQHHRATWKPLPCVGTIPISEVGFLFVLIMRHILALHHRSS